MRKIIFIMCITIFCSYTEAKVDKSRTDKFQLFYESKVEDKQKIEQIKSNVIIIDNACSTYHKIGKSIFGYSSEGGVIIFYYKNKELKKISLNIFGEMGQSATKYYLNNDHLIAIKKESIKYNQPFYMKGFKIKSKTKVTYYFNDGIPMYIINKQHPNSKKNIDNFMKYLFERIYSLSEIMEMFNNPEAEILSDEEIEIELSEDHSKFFK